MYMQSQLPGMNQMVTGPWGFHSYAASLAGAHWGGAPELGAAETGFGPAPSNWGPLPGWSQWQPRLDAWEDEAGVLVELEMAGADPDTIEVELDQFHNFFTVIGKRTQGGPRKAIYRELPGGNFHRVVPLPWPAGEVEATYADGILQVRVPRSAEPNSAAGIPQAAPTIHGMPGTHSAAPAKTVRPNRKKS